MLSDNAVRSAESGITRPARSPLRPEGGPLRPLCPPAWPPLRRADDECLNALNQALLEALQRSGQAFLSGATLDGTFALRACLINPRTRAADLDHLVGVVRDLGAQLAGGGA